MPVGVRARGGRQPGLQGSLEQRLQHTHSARGQKQVPLTPVMLTYWPEAYPLFACSGCLLAHCGSQRLQARLVRRALACRTASAEPDKGMDSYGTMGLKTALQLRADSIA